MNAFSSLARDAFELIPVQGGFAFGYGHGEISDEQADEIARFTEPRGAALVRSSARFFFVVPAFVAYAQEDYAGHLLCDLANTGLLRFTCPSA